MLFKPYVKPDAGTQIGLSYLKSFVRCPRKWYNTYARPTLAEDGTLHPTGITTQQTALPLLSGGIFHSALEDYYLSGIRDGADTGEYNVDAAIARLDAEHKTRKEEYSDEESAEKDYETIRKMLLDYAETYGPGGAFPDYPSIQVVCDPETGEPYIEKEFIGHLGYGNYYMTSKIDLIISDRGFIKGLEHKTSVASFAGTRKNSIHTDAQFTGEIFCLQQNIIDVPLHGVKINVVVKNRSPRSTVDVAVRETTNRSDAQLEEFKDSAVSILQQIDERMGLLDDWIAKGVEPEKALSVWFPILGTYTEECTAYRRPCDFTMLCKRPDNTTAALKLFKPRTYAEDQVDEENKQ